MNEPVNRGRAPSQVHQIAVSRQVDRRAFVTIYSTAEIKGNFITARLIIPVENHFRWKQQIKVGSTEIARELTANLHAQCTIILKTIARLFGEMAARDLIVEAGALLVGNACIGLNIS